LALPLALGRLREEGCGGGCDRQEDGCSLHARQNVTSTPMRSLMALLLAAAPALALPPHEAANAARHWRTKHEQQIVDELCAFVASPNLASDRENIEHSAAALQAMLLKRGVFTRLLTMEGAPPLVLGTLAAAKSSAPTYTFYAHYDGQPVDAA